MKKTDVLRYYEDDHFDAFWDNQVTDYPLDRFPWYDMILAVVQEVNPKCDDLSELHNFFDRTEIVPLRKKVERYVRTKEFAEKLDEYLKITISFTNWIKKNIKDSKDDVSAACNDYLKVLGLIAVGHSWIKVLEVSFNDYDNNKGFYEDKIQTARFFFQRVLPRIDTHCISAMSGSGYIMDFKFN